MTKTALFITTALVLLASTVPSLAQTQRSEDGAACKNQRAIESLVQTFEANIEIKTALKQVNDMAKATSEDWACKMVIVIASKEEIVESIPVTNGIFVVLHVDVFGIFDPETDMTRNDGPKELYMSRFFYRRGEKGA